jgi:hypothetical protein
VGLKRKSLCGSSYKILLIIIYLFIYLYLLGEAGAAQLQQSSILHSLTYFLAEFATAAAEAATLLGS